MKPQAQLTRIPLGLGITLPLSLQAPNPKSTRCSAFILGPADLPFLGLLPALSIIFRASASLLLKPLGGSRG